MDGLLPQFSDGEFYGEIDSMGAKFFAFFYGFCFYTFK
jgi:hypothetical protein